jgi:hypothetical protein
MMAMVLAPAAQAGLMYLPTSSHYQGFINDGVYRIEFAVYDTQGGNEFAEYWSGPGQYTYVYQLFNNSGSANMDIELFKISGIGLGAINSQEQIGSVDDPAGGVESTDAYFDVSLTVGSWEFADATLIAGKHSVFLVLSSDHDWVKGQYTILPASDFPVPGDDGGEIPEPMTLAFLAMGGLGLLGCRRVQS